MAAPQRRRDLGLDLGELRQQGRGLAFEFSVDLAGGGRWIRTIGSPPEIVVDPSGSHRVHRAKYGCLSLSARPRVRCLCPPGKIQHLLPKSVFDRPGSDRFGTWHPLFLTRDRWFEYGFLQRRAINEPQSGTRQRSVQRCRKTQRSRPSRPSVRFEALNEWAPFKNAASVPARDLVVLHEKMWGGSSARQRGGSAVVRGLRRSASASSLSAGCASARLPSSRRSMPRGSSRPPLSSK